tara:strand:+ start:50 stop:346 length:297 start_codon:yes stop_codon:yes gene_type:complete
MRKRRIIPTIPASCLIEGKDKDKYQPVLYSSILEGIEQSLKSSKTSFILARVDDGTNITDVTIIKDSFKTNLETVLDYYEQKEEYELCSRTFKLLKQV